eukprot:TRINITY_DN4225_c0_g1_i1.p1 TRINITY_DN4225_c0_g1~~TRINITY_DN4225_c0_g1_i1.p1  ORF type:complete len:119 (-),score=16.82 TRINITY_DN4225_c0_g1_i1:63-419(-)
MNKSPFVARTRGQEPSAHNSQTDQFLEQDGDRQLNAISDKVRAIKEMSTGIKKDIVETSSMLDQMERGMSSTSGMLQGSIARLTNLSHTATTRQMMMFIGGVVVAFVGLYYLLSGAFS